jgi:antagonist of KipI
LARGSAYPAKGSAYPVCRPAGDRHLILALGEDICPETSDLVYAVDALLSTTAVPGLRETTPAYNSVLIRYDPLETCFEAISAAAIAAAVVGAGLGRERRVGARGSPEVTIPVVYGGEYGPDLEEVARRTGLSAREVARRHAAGLYRVQMIGFAPGFGYLEGLDPSLATPRRDAPRPQVPAGSVGIAGEQTGVYPRVLPGGWQIIGRTPLQLWRPATGRPSLLVPGGGVRFAAAGWGRTGWRRAEARARLEEERQVRIDAEGLGRAGEERLGFRTGRCGPPVTLVAHVLAVGPWDTIQDGGRWAFSRLGVPESGVLDWPALVAANRAVGNRPGDAGLEATYGGLEIRFTLDVAIALGPGARATLEGRSIPAGRPVLAREGQILTLEAGIYPRTYLALGGGGLACPRILGSRSTYTPAEMGGQAGRRLRAGDDLFGFAAEWEGEEASLKNDSPTVGGPQRSDPALGLPVTEVRAVPGPQDHLFSLASVAALFEREWRVLGLSDRRACLLDGTPLCAPVAGGVSDGTPAGSIQVPPSGLPIVLLADHQTTGGYARIATVIAPDLCLLARAWPQGRVRFRRITTSEARRIWYHLPAELVADWPGRSPAGAVGPALRDDDRNPVPRRGRLFTLEARGRSHLVSVEESPPR